MSGAFGRQDARIWAYRNSEQEIELWTSYGKSLKGQQIWFRYLKETPKGYADVHARLLEIQPDYGPCWWGYGDTTPEERGLEFIGEVKLNVMIETDETGNRQIKMLLKTAETGRWNEWERNFIAGLEGKTYQQLTARQKSVISGLFEKI